MQSFILFDYLCIVCNLHCLKHHWPNNDKTLVPIINNKAWHIYLFHRIHTQWVHSEFYKTLIWSNFSKIVMCFLIDLIKVPWSKKSGINCYATAWYLVLRASESRWALAFSFAPDAISFTLSLSEGCSASLLSKGVLHHSWEMTFSAISLFSYGLNLNLVFTFCVFQCYPCQKVV